MDRSIISLICSFLLLSASSASAFDVTKILSQHPEYSNFNDLLTKTGLANEINSKRTITLLAIPNGAIGDVTSKPNDVVKRILTTHVVLDYFDTGKLEKMNGKTAKLTTMFQQSGKALNDQGFLNVTAKDNTFVFGSAVKGAQLNSRLEKSVMTQPYNISILGISQPIVTPGIDGPVAPNSAPAPEVAAASPKAHAPTPASHKSSSSPQQADSPAPSVEETKAFAPSDSPPADADQAPSPSSAGKLKVSLGFFVVLASILSAY
ncbi:unnamed protein product [Withania somnifera]